MVVFVIESKSNKTKKWKPLKLGKLVRNADGTVFAEYPVFENSMDATTLLNNIYDKLDLSGKYDYTVRAYKFEKINPELDN